MLVICSIFIALCAAGTLRQQSLWIATGVKETGFTSCPYSMMYSGDGVTWTGITNSPFVNVGQTPAKVAYSASQDKWVALGDASCGTAAVSTDGINWNSCFSPVARPSAIVFGNNLWVVGGSQPEEIAFSTNLTSWTKVTGVMQTVREIAYSSVQNKYVAVGRGGTQSGRPDHFVSTMAYSSNGQNWTLVPSAMFTADEGFSVSYSVARNQWIAAGSYTNWATNIPQTILASSTDAITWTLITTYPFNTTMSTGLRAVVFS
jgi:hypothetical protein